MSKNPSDLNRRGFLAGLAAAFVAGGEAVAGTFRTYGGNAGATLERLSTDRRIRKPLHWYYSGQQGNSPTPGTARQNVPYNDIRSLNTVTGDGVIDTIWLRATTTAVPPVDLTYDQQRAVFWNFYINNVQLFPSHFVTASNIFLGPALTYFPADVPYRTEIAFRRTDQLIWRLDNSQAIAIWFDMFVTGYYT